MTIRLAASKDIEVILSYDRHISRDELKNSIALSRTYVLEEHSAFAGWLRYGLFWDNTPFLNMLFILENYRNKGFGKAAVEYWEREMLSSNYRCVMTSTASDETAKDFYKKLGYTEIGGFNYPNDPYEIILLKKLTHIDT